MSKFIVELWLDGYEDEDVREKACEEFIFDQLNMTASSVKVEKFNESTESELTASRKRVEELELSMKRAFSTIGCNCRATTEKANDSYCAPHRIIMEALDAVKEKAKEPVSPVAEEKGRMELEDLLCWTKGKLNDANAKIKADAVEIERLNGIIKNKNQAINDYIKEFFQ